ncbi:hypothetical protein [Hwanghaeella sp.]|uniref:hypothetical protein n=1 Tax=Hwanghaeella sp. TaxID=2605943 RepID=UPI003CCB80AD
MSEFTKNTLSGQSIPQNSQTDDPSMDEIAFYVQRGKQLHSKAVRNALFAGFCSVGKAADRASASIAQVFRKAGHSPS